ncbi:MAG: DUF3618 domain-containing protein [Rhodothermales bacterium]
MAERRSDLESSERPPTPEYAPRVEPSEPVQAVEPADVRKDAEATNRAQASSEPARKPYAEKDTDEIVHDIQRTRSEMSGTLSAIEAKFSPENVKSEVKDTVQEVLDAVKEQLSPRNLSRLARHTIKETGIDMFDTIKANPLPSLIAGLSVGWLIFKGDDQNQDNGYYEEERDYYRYGNRPNRGGDYQRARGYREGPDYDRDASYERDTYETEYYAGGTYDDDDERSAGDKAKQQAGQAKERAGEMADQAQERMQHLGDEVQYRARRATNDLERVIYERPLAAGAVAIGIGALVGAALPSTQKENELMGRQSDHLKEEAETRAKRIADRTADAAKDAAQDVKETAKEAAQDVEKEAKSAAQDVKETAKAETEKEKEDAKKEHSKNS